MKKIVLIVLLLVSSVLFADEEFSGEVRIGGTFGSATVSLYSSGYFLTELKGGISGFRIQRRGGMSNNINDAYSYYYLGYESVDVSLDGSSLSDSMDTFIIGARFNIAENLDLNVRAGYRATRLLEMQYQGYNFDGYLFGVTGVIALGYKFN